MQYGEYSDVIPSAGGATIRFWKKEKIAGDDYDLIGIFNFFGNILGYLLKALYLVVHNYGIAIILFTIISKILLFPFSVKQQKSTAAQSKLTAKQQELQKKYSNDKVKYNEELQLLYQKEGVNPTSGCLTALIPFPIMLGLYYAVIFPIKNVLHYSKDIVEAAGKIFESIPGIGESFARNSFYNEMQIVRYFDELKPHLTMFSEAQLEELEVFSKSFNFAGIDLLATPKGSAFTTMLWIIPILCLISAWLQQFYMNKTNPAMQQQQGCMKYSMYMLPLITVWFAYTMPAAIGFYWVVSQITGFIQTVIIHKFYGPLVLTAKQEAGRAVLRLSQEEKIEPLPLEQQKLIEDRINASANINAEKNQKKNTTKKNK